MPPAIRTRLPATAVAVAAARATRIRPTNWIVPSALDAAVEPPAPMRTPTTSPAMRTDILLVPALLSLIHERRGQPVARLRGGERLPRPGGVRFGPVECVGQHE